MAESFLEPVTWKGWWNQELEDTELELDYFIQGDLELQFWCPEGIPKYSLAQI